MEPMLVELARSLILWAGSMEGEGVGVGLECCFCVCVCVCVHVGVCMGVCVEGCMMR